MLFYASVRVRYSCGCASVSVTREFSDSVKALRVVRRQCELMCGGDRVVVHESGAGCKGGGGALAKCCHSREALCRCSIVITGREDTEDWRDAVLG